MQCDSRLPSAISVQGLPQVDTNVLTALQCLAIHLAASSLSEPSTVLYNSSVEAKCGVRAKIAFHFRQTLGKHVRTVHEKAVLEHTDKPS